MFEQQSFLVGRIFPPKTKPWVLPGPHHRGLTTMRTLLAPLNGNKEGSKCLMVLRVKPKPTRSPTNSLYTPMDNTNLHSISSVKWGLLTARERSVGCSLGYYIPIKSIYTSRSGHNLWLIGVRILRTRFHFVLSRTCYQPGA